MLNADDLAEAEGTADWILREADVDPDRPISLWTIATRVMRVRPRRARMLLAEGTIIRVDEQQQIVVRPRLSPEREEIVIAHELGHWARPDREHSAYEEAMADAIGAALVAPRPAVRRIVRTIGHRVYDLARLLHTEQALALLRIGEVTGRPVLLLRREPIARGELFEWGPRPLALPRAIAHPIRVDSSRWGVMAA